MNDLQDLINRLNYQKNLPVQEQKRFISQNLDLREAIKRCENIHGGKQCTTLWGTMAVKKCPLNYKRFGCCLCRPPCSSDQSLETQNYQSFGLYCNKLPTYNTSIYDSLLACQENESRLSCDDYPNFYTEECKIGYSRLGKTRCVYKCPGNFHDVGDKCGPKEILNIGMPFLWMLGDTKDTEVSRNFFGN